MHVPASPFLPCTRNFWIRPFLERKKKGVDPGPEREEKRRRRRTEATGVESKLSGLGVSGVRVAEVESYYSVIIGIMGKGEGPSVQGPGTGLAKGEGGGGTSSRWGLTERQKVQRLLVWTYEPQAVGLSELELNYNPND